ncbi:S8 family serine peptidase [Facklamia miroungae]|uniref:PA domain-containing protein n=1 Tax=Facklamia miroungae TaxID=120956 RepID=A0A1G7RM06_9LACT|nr:S8 family serine peptidase [Facklamia miroungae]NKZ29380.1 S8 family serine peptidase [Facklamia miroungae]SDG11239.1 PA domain-containing protein [Facklamia miroungae]
MNNRLKLLSSCGLALMMLSQANQVDVQAQETKVDQTQAQTSVQAEKSLKVQEVDKTAEPIHTSEVKITEKLSETNVVTTTSEKVETNKTVETTETTETTETVETTETTERIETTEVVETAEVVETTEVNETNEASKPSEESETTVESESDETSKEKSENNTLAEEKIKIIVRTNNKAAIDRANYHNEKEYQLAVKESELEVKQTIKEITELLAGQGLALEGDQEYSASFTGFSALANQATIEHLKKMTQVLSVDISHSFKRPDAEANMNNSGPLIGMDLLSEFQSKYKGENIVVSVIDTGFDPYHRDFVLADDVEKRYDEAEMNAMIESLGLPGKWYSNKVAYGYNYADNIDTLQSKNEHGNHVAGTIGANGDPENGGIRGIAPHVQLLLMKAFSEDQVNATVYEDIWMKAFDDSVKLGADIINMSLGMSSGFNIMGDTPMAKAVQNARDKGILPMIAAGNDRNATWGTDYTQLGKNPDNGTMGYPASVDPSMSVASFDNLKEMKRYVEAIVDGKSEYFPGSFTFPEGENKAPLPLIEFGKGNKEDYEQYLRETKEEVDFSGKIVLVQRGDASFNEKYQLAKEHHAAGLIIYDNVDSPYTMEMTGIKGLDTKTPIMFVTQKSGIKLKDLAISNQDALFKISKELYAFNTLTGGNLSEFSSWGPSTDLLLKPDIAGPGGFIYSLMSDDRYQTMSGTSMATPHLSGMAALVMQRLYDEGILVRHGKEKDPLQDDLAMLFLMNTAIPKLNTLKEGASYFTPIQQGAGLANIHKALDNLVTVVATNETDTKADGKLELKEVKDQFDASFMLKNYGKNDQTFEVSYVLLKDTINEEGRYTEISEKVREEVLGEITVKAGQTASMDQIISTMGIDNNQYVQGFFFFKPLDSEGTDLSLPFFGFKGEWDKLPIIDEMIDFSDAENVNFLPIEYDNGGVDKTAFVRKGLKEGWDYFNAWKVKDDKVIFVNSNENNKFENKVTPKLAFLRDAVNVTFHVENAKGERIKDLAIINRMFKVARLYEKPYLFLQDPWGTAWDYTDTFGQQVDEGEYYYVIEAQIDAPDAERQRYEYKFVLDNTDANLKADRKENTVTLSVEDNLAGIYAVEVASDEVLVSRKEIDKVTNPQLLKETFTINLEEDLKDKDLNIWVYDNARNVKQYRLLANGTLEEVKKEEGKPAEVPEEKVTEDNKKPGEKPSNPAEYITEIGLDTSDLPSIVTNSPWYYQPIGSQVEFIDLSGEVHDYKEVHYIEYRITDEKGNVIVDSQPVAFEEVDGHILFKKDIPTEKLVGNEVYSVEITAYVMSPNDKLVKQQVAHRIRRDHQAPELKVNQVFGPDKDLLYFEIDFSDNMNYVELWANNDMIGRVDKTFDSLTNPIPVNGKVLYTIPKSKLGEKLTFTVYDDFGNQSETTSIPVQLMELKEVPYKVVPKFNINLAVDAVKIVQEGKEGKANIDEKGKLIILEAAQDQIIEYGPAEIPFETIRRKDSTLLEGVEVTTQEGVKGLVNPLTGEIIVPAQDKIIEMGTKAYTGPERSEDTDVINMSELDPYINRLEIKIADVDGYHRPKDISIEEIEAFLFRVKATDPAKISKQQFLLWKNMLIDYANAFIPIHGSTPQKGESFDGNQNAQTSVEGASVLPKTGEVKHNYSLVASLLSFIGLSTIAYSKKK